MNVSRVSAEFPASEYVPERSKIDFASPKFNPLHLQTKPLFLRRIEAEFDLAASPDHPLPRKRARTFRSQQARHCAVI